MDESPLSAHALSLSASTGGRGLTPGLTTVVLPPPQTRGPSENTPLTAAQQKKARDKEYQRRKRANAAQLRSQQQAAAAAAAASASTISLVTTLPQARGELQTGLPSNPANRTGARSNSARLDHALRLDLISNRSSCASWSIEEARSAASARHIAAR